jgi:tRNA threonylcarbamoyladenosine biosynthesis protein TsaB
MLLALDTSTLTLSLALVERGELVEEVVEGPPRKQSEILPGVVDELLRRRGVRVFELEAIAVGLGPGSFTGLRIGLSTAKALCYAARIPLCGVRSLEALSLDGPEGKRIHAIAEARRQELYVGVYRVQGGVVERLEPEEVLTPEQLAARLFEREDAVAMGPSVRPYRAQLLAAGAPAERLLRWRWRGWRGRRRSISRPCSPPSRTTCAPASRSGTRSFRRCPARRWRG